MVPCLAVYVACNTLLHVVVLQLVPKVNVIFFFFLSKLKTVFLKPLIKKSKIEQSKFENYKLESEKQKSSLPLIEYLRIKFFLHGNFSCS